MQRRSYDCRTRRPNSSPRQWWPSCVSTCGSCDRDDSIRAIIITGGSASAFLTHFDVAEVRAASEQVAPTVSPRLARLGLALARGGTRLPLVRRLVRRSTLGGLVPLLAVHDLLVEIERSKKLYIAAINGHALGGGCELALACDVILMAEGPARIGLPEACLGQIPSLGVPRLVRRIGADHAVIALLEATLFDAQAAVDAGIATRAVPADALIGQAKELAARAGRQPLSTVTAMKAAIRASTERSLGAATASGLQQFVASASAPAAREQVVSYSSAVAELSEPTPAAIYELIGSWDGPDPTRAG